MNARFIVQIVSLCITLIVITAHGIKLYHDYFQRYSWKMLSVIYLFEIALGMLQFFDSNQADNISTVELGLVIGINLSFVAIWCNRIIKRRLRRAFNEQMKNSGNSPVVIEDFWIIWSVLVIVSTCVAITAGVIYLGPSESTFYRIGWTFVIIAIFELIFILMYASMNSTKPCRISTVLLSISKFILVTLGVLFIFGVSDYDLLNTFYTTTILYDTVCCFFIFRMKSSVLPGGQRSPQDQATMVPRRNLSLVVKNGAYVLTPGRFTGSSSSPVSDNKYSPSSGSAGSPAVLSNSPPGKTVAFQFKDSKEPNHRTTSSGSIKVIPQKLSKEAVTPSFESPRKLQFVNDTFNHSMSNFDITEEKTGEYSIACSLAKHHSCKVDEIKNKNGTPVNATPNTKSRDLVAVDE